MLTVVEMETEGQERSQHKPVQEKAAWEAKADLRMLLAPTKESGSALGASGWLKYANQIVVRASGWELSTPLTRQPSLTMLQHVSCTGQQPNLTYRIYIEGLSTFLSIPLSTPPLRSTPAARIKLGCDQFRFNKVPSAILHPVATPVTHPSVSQMKGCFSRRRQMQLQLVTLRVQQLLV